MAGLLRNNYNKAVWLLCHTAFILGLMPAIAQHNLVPNGGFELLDTCPNNYNQLHFAPPWRGLATPDLFNSCSYMYSGVYVPKNVWGFQFPKSGNGYAGFGVGPADYPNYYNVPKGIYCHEYLQVELSEGLKSNQSYCYQYFVSPTISHFNRYVMSEFSVLLSDTPVSINWNNSMSHYAIIKPATHTYFTGFTTDTAIWYEVKGEFLAKGGEKYLTIGFFKYLAPSDILWLSSQTTDAGAYYYIDDVSLYYCGPDTVPKPTELQLPVIPNVFTPNGDGFNDVFTFRNHEGWELETCIRNRWGQVVFEGQNDHWWDGTIHGQQASPGVYYYTVTARNRFGQHETFHGVVTLLR
jgi:gliding motility-associated-like protein